MNTDNQTVYQPLYNVLLNGKVLLCVAAKSRNHALNVARKLLADYDVLDLISPNDRFTAIETD